MDRARRFHEQIYREQGAGAQRRYPSEELSRFLGGYYFGLPRAERERLRLLEVGCGSGGNLWAIAGEGIQAHGIDLAQESLPLCRGALAARGVAASLVCASMTDLPYASGTFDILVDVFSSYCLPEAEFRRYLRDAARVLRAGGRYFSYHPSKASDAFKNHAPAKLIDASTLDGILRETSPYHGNCYPFHFTSPEEYRAELLDVGLRTVRCERISRTYRDGAEYFEFVSIVAEKGP